MNLVEKIVAGSFVIIGLGLVLTKPTGTTSLGSAITNLFTGSVKQLQAG